MKESIKKLDKSLNERMYKYRNSLEFCKQKAEEFKKKNNPVYETIFKNQIEVLRARIEELEHVLKGLDKVLSNE